jgi:hypothetical protein
VPAVLLPDIFDSFLAKEKRARSHRGRIGMSDSVTSGPGA